MPVVFVFVALLLGAQSAEGQPRHLGRRPPDARVFDRLNNMTPQQRERVLETLPPARRQQLENRLDRFNQLPDSEKKRLREAYDHFRQLPPDEQEAVRQVYRQFNDLPEDRRLPLRKELARLSKMDPEKRRSRLDSKGFRERFSADEREMIESLIKRIGPAAAPID